MTPDRKPAFLVVDDSPVIRKMIMSALRPLNPVCREASSGLEALEQIMIQEYDVILLDLNMPDMHGMEFLTFVRKQKVFHNIPILVITTQNDEEIRQAVLSAGANSFITKPFSPQHVLERVRALLAK